MPDSQGESKNFLAFDRRWALNLLPDLMAYEMELCKASRQELISIAKVVCVRLEKQPVHKRVPFDGVQHLAMKWSQLFPPQKAKENT